MPLYLVFPDRSLEEIAARQPTDRKSFAEIHGVGKRKLEVCCEPFTSLVADYVTNNP